MLVQSVQNPQHLRSTHNMCWSLNATIAMSWKVSINESVSTRAKPIKKKKQNTIKCLYFIEVGTYNTFLITWKLKHHCLIVPTSRISNRNIRSMPCTENSVQSSEQQHWKRLLNSHKMKFLEATMFLRKELKCVDWEGFPTFFQYLYFCTFDKFSTSHNYGQYSGSWTIL